ncbi:MAG: YesL family protein, partial [Lachnospiraceae bacterium]|nr:YesL family protein [Lachnospiraceae bacterium]
MRLFNLDSPLMQALNKMADLLWLNILTMICCIPIITVGPSLTALHYMALKIARDEECYITRDYFKSFRLNFRQGTIIWLIELFLILILAGDFYIMRNTEMQFGNVISIILVVVAVLLLFTSTFVFPVLAKFDNTIP